METLVYLVVFVTLSVGAVLLMISLNNLYAQYQVRQALYLSSTNAMERILLEIRQADTVDSEASNFFETEGVLQLAQAASTTRFALIDGALRLSLDDIDVGTVHGSDVVVEAARFFHYQNSGRHLIRAELELTATQRDYSESIMITGAAIVRGSYDQR